MERVHLGILGPFNVSSKGSKYVLGVVERPTSVRPLSKVLCSPRVPDLPFMLVGRVSQDQLPLLLLGPAMGVRAVVATWALLPGLVHQCPLVWALVTLVLLALTCPEPHGNQHQVLLWAPHLDLAHWAVPLLLTQLQDFLSRFLLRPVFRPTRRWQVLQLAKPHLWPLPV